MPGRITTEIVGRASGKVMRLSRELDPAADDFKKGLGTDAELIMQSHSPKGETQRLSRGIHMVNSGQTVEVVSDAAAIGDGYRYTAVTRFGHRKMMIVPVRRGFSASVVSTGRSRGRGRRAALRFSIGGTMMFRGAVKGYKPARDWVDTASTDVQSATRVKVSVLRERIRRALR